MSDSEDLQALAGEYVLGTLGPVQRRAAQQRLAVEPELAAAVQAWEQRLLPLAALADAVAPSPQLWQRIARSVGVITAAAALPAPRVRRGLWSSLPLWRALAGAGIAASLALSALLVSRIAAPPPAPQYLVVLVAPQDKAPGWVVQASGTRSLSLIPLGVVAVPPDKALQFWTKAEGWNAPVSLGLVAPGRAARVSLDKLPPLTPNQLFELTLEPATGSPIGRPTGPIQFIGRAVQVL